jgi:hypothetical protein
MTPTTTASPPRARRNRSSGQQAAKFARFEKLKIELTALLSAIEIARCFEKRRVIGSGVYLRRYIRQFEYNPARQRMKRRVA